MILVPLALSIFTLGSSYSQDAIPEAVPFQRHDLVKRVRQGDGDPYALKRDWERYFDRRNWEQDLYVKRWNWLRLFPIQESRTVRIEGERIYHGFVKKAYRYDVHLSSDEDVITVEVRIHFHPSKGYTRKAARLEQKKDPRSILYDTGEDLNETLDRTLRDAAMIWNLSGAPGVRFHFRRMDRAEDAHYSVKLTNTVAAEYDKFIVAPVDKEMLAHEIGHMMGLDDEYRMIGSNLSPHEWGDAIRQAISGKATSEDRKERADTLDMKCQLDSIMCLRRRVMPYHVDHILGRIPQ